MMNNPGFGKAKRFSSSQVRIALATASLSFCVLLYLVLSVSVSGLLADFPSYSEDTVMLLLSLPSVTALISILSMPLLLKKMRHKTVALCSLLCLLLGGVMCLAFRTSMPMLIGASCIMGLAYGGLSAIYPLLINRYFDAEGNAFVVGLCSCTMQLGALLSKLIGGYLASWGWSSVYYTYLFVVLAIIIVCLCLPKEIERKGEARDAVSLRPLRNKRLWLFSSIAFLFPVLYFAISTHLSVYIEVECLGTAAQTGALSALGAAVAAASALLFSRILKLTKGHCFELSYLLIGLGYLFAGLYVSRLGAVVASAAGAAGISIFSPYLFYCINTSCKEADTPLITAFVLTVVNLAYSLSAYINRIFSRLLFDGSSAGVFLFSGLAAMLGFVLLCFIKGKERVQ